MLKSKRLASVGVLAAMLVVAFAMVSQGAHVSPEVIPGNPDCEDAGYGFGVKINQSPNGTFALVDDGDDVELTGGAASDPNNSVTISNSDGVSFNWSATLGIDAVIVKGGPNANLYEYDPEATGDTGLTAPINPDNGTPYGLSHIEFCYDYELEVSKTANGSYDRTITWELEKSVDPDEHEGWIGDEFTSTWTVEVDKTVVEDNYKVTGSVTINNPSPVAVSFSAADVIDPTGDNIAVSLSCPSNTVPAGGQVVCTYEADEGDGIDGDQEKNTVTVTSLTNGVGGDSAEADIDFTANVIGDEEITVDDDRNEGDFPEDVSDDTTWTYDETFECSSDESDYTDGKDEDNYPNTATAKGDDTDLSDSADVDVICWLPGIEKDADPSFDRTWTWDIDKEADQTTLLLSLGQLIEVNYTVTVSASSVDDNFDVNGDITVTNPSDTLTLEGTLSDLLDDDTVGTISGCTGDGVDFDALTGELSVPAGGTAVCSYTATPADADATENTATLTLENGSVSDSVDLDWDMTEIDECVDVTDDNAITDVNLNGLLGTVCADDLVDGEYEFTYSLWFGAHPDADVVLECGENQHVNTAAFETNDTETTGEDSWTVDATVSCEVGCTLTPGYWKTHSKYGPAPYDDTWAQIGEDTTFFLSNQSYYEVLWTPPSGGNAYYILAHAYIAAELNFLNGASAPSGVQDAFGDATELFENNGPGVFDGLKGKQLKELREVWIDLAGILDDYNNGLIGPGHCSE